MSKVTVSMRRLKFTIHKQHDHVDPVNTNLNCTLEWVVWKVARSCGVSTMQETIVLLNRIVDLTIRVPIICRIVHGFEFDITLQTPLPSLSVFVSLPDLREVRCHFQRVLLD